MNATDTIREALRDFVGDGEGVDGEILARHNQTVREDLLDVEKMAEAMADDWNPGRDPILTAMFRDYAATIRTALLGGDE